ncbi:universal stress protein [Paeniglutamicibacter sp. NPDC091659]|uniref:universal stress protein n=1 Tax=Paeniglutamicibacter sp. NPDC091659 TaxID=3364389 RepID=UPI00382E7652
MENVVLVGVDGSPESRGAASWALHEAEVRQWPVWFAYVFPKPTIADPAVDSAYLRASHRTAQLIFDELEAEAKARGIQVQSVALPGRANEVLVKLSNDAGLNVVGRRSHSGFSARLGSVSSALAAHSRCPTAVIPHGWGRRPAGQVTGNGPSASAGQIVAAVEPGPGALNVLSAAAGLAQRDSISLRVVSVASNQHEEAGDSSLSELLAQVEKQYHGLECSVHFLSGKPATEIAHAARDAVLLVVGTRGFGGLSGFMHGSVSQALLRQMASPMLVVPNSIPD